MPIPKISVRIDAPGRMLTDFDDAMSTSLGNLDTMTGQVNDTVDGINAILPDLESVPTVLSEVEAVAATVASNTSLASSAAATVTTKAAEAAASAVLAGEAQAGSEAARDVAGGYAAAAAGYAAGLNMPTVTTSNAGQIPAVKLDGSGYELKDPSEIGDGSGPWSAAIPATYLSNASLTASIDLTEKLSPGVRVQADCGADGLQYGTTASSSYSDPTTTVTLEMDDGDALTSNLVSIMHGNDDKKSLVNHADQHATGGRDPIITVIASTPAHYARSALATVASTTDAEGRRTWCSPDRVTLNVNDSGYYIAGLQAKDLNDAANYDSDSQILADPTKRAGKDLNVYACQDTGGIRLLFSANSTYPTGYTASNSRKIGGFHCLCVAAGVISGHPGSGYLAGDIVPPSIWDLQWRPRCAPEGMRYVAGVWQDIYMPSVIGGALRPAYGGTMADGASAPVFDWYDFTEWLAREGKRLAMPHRYRNQCWRVVYFCPLFLVNTNTLFASWR